MSRLLSLATGQLDMIHEQLEGKRNADLVTISAGDLRLLLAHAWRLHETVDHVQRICGELNVMGATPPEGAADA